MRSLLSPAHSRLRRLVAAAAATGLFLLGPAGVAHAAGGPAFLAHANPASNQFGSMVPEVLSASGLPADATGTVDFTDLYNNFLCSSPVVNGATSGCDYFLGYQAGNTYTITATYSGGGTYVASTATTTYTVTPAPSSFTAAASPTSQVYGNPVTLSESGFPSYASGSITFKDTATGAVLCAIANMQATQSCQTNGTQNAGTENVTAFYSGDNDFQPSTATTSYTIAKASISPTFTVTPNPSTYGQTLTFTESGFPAAATGTITYTGFYAGQVFCTETLPATSCQTTSPVDVNTKNPVLNYPGDNNYNAVIYRGAQFTVTQAPSPSFAATATPNPTAYGTGPETFAFSGLGSDSTGTVTFTDPATGALLCTVAVAGATGSCTSTTPSPQPVGAYQVDAAYSGDASYLTATTTTTYDVTAAPTTFTVTITPNPTDYATPVTFDSTGVPADATGTIDYTVQGAILCTATLPTTSCATDGTQAPGGYSVVANYSGDANYTDFTSTGTAYTVNKAPAAFTAAAATNPADYATAVDLIDLGLPSGDGSGPAASGTITYTDTTTGLTLCTTTLPATTCSTDGTQPSGTQHVSAAYSGDAFYAASAAEFSYTVKLPTTMGVAVTPSPATPNQAIVLQAAGLPTDATGTVTFGYSPVGGQWGDVFCTAPVASMRCSATAPTQAGTYRVTGIYSGDAKYSSVSTTTTLTIAIAAVPDSPASGAKPTSATLAFTGGDLAPGILGLILVTAGAVLLWAARRRQGGPAI